MGILRKLGKYAGPRRFAGDVEGRRFEVRIGTGGGESVLVDGKLVSERPWAYWSGMHDHFFTLEQGEGERNYEVSVHDRSGGIGVSYVVSVKLKGREVATLRAVDPTMRERRCYGCGYPLRGLEVLNGEVRCPECGKHTPEAILPAEEEGASRDGAEDATAGG